MLVRTLLLFVLGTSIAVAQPSVSGPANAGTGSQVTINVTGSSNQRDFVTIVAKGSKAGHYGDYVYVTQPALKLMAPSTPGDYEIRLLAAQSPYATLASQPLKLEQVAATVAGPAQVAAGSKFEVRWTGPNNERDYVGIGDADPKKRLYITYVYTSNGSPVTLAAPDEAGAYELRYYLGKGDTVIASRPITVGSVSATVSAATQVAAGGTVTVKWTGPNNPRDFITMVKAGTADKQYGAYEYTSKGNPLVIRAPDEPGDYEIRYLSAQAYATLGAAKIAVTANTASVQAPATAVAGSTFPVQWKGPNNQRDYLTIVPKGAREGESGNYAYTGKGNPAALLAPLEPGEYEVRYSTSQSHMSLARAAVRITPAKEEPGLISVTTANALPAGSAVEIILDASGSMLQRIGSQRRIDIAKQTLAKLTSSTIPAGTPFALRVFGREIDSCQTDLEIPMGPLDAAAAGAKIGKLEAKNNAKTPIGASLEKVASDLQSVKGERLVIVLTDGEETCGGDPAAAIAGLKKASTMVRVNIVGFAIDDAKLAATFRHWSDLGSGLYFDARDAVGLNAAMAKAMRPGYEVVDAQGKVVASGVAGADPVRVMPGSYTVRLMSKTGKPQAAVVKAKETTAVSL